jgi:hypothetical protein
MPDSTLKTTVNIDQIIADWGEYYLNEGQNMDQLHMLPFESFDTRDAFTVIPTNDTILRESNIEVTSILQQYQEDFTPKGSMTFKPVQIPLFQMKIDERIHPGKIMRSWLAFLATNKATVEDWPLIKFMIEQYFVKQSMEDMEMYAIYKGVHEEPAAGVPGDPGKTMNGIEMILDGFVEDDLLVPITTGAPQADPADFVTQVESFVKGIEEKYRYIGFELNMSRTLRDRFKEGMQKKYNMQYAQVSELLTVRNYEQVRIAGRPSMMGKNRWWGTPKFNALLGVKGFENKDAFEFEREDRKLKLWTDWWAGAGFVQPKLIFMNDQN